ncbi:hypothetical protein SeMB42_g04809 [Synchytrium endobioticum]|uniref:Protein kinase domain-containing protein n=1 Tax=Synchytrium endobioticum TaxID=286115 RepID=A0A507DG35_9FUNG|nr:hypothetical protein SeMB42_g04809 [Synchytrium endobioticum]TPX49858.1 hypothetical protein SeLEV6574_g01246 [Synchytrium endobioticum]
MQIAHPKHISPTTVSHQRSRSDTGNARSDYLLRTVSPRYESLPLSSPISAARPTTSPTITLTHAMSFNEEILPAENPYVVFRSVVTTWNADDVSDWIHNIGFPDLAPLFMIKGVTGLILLELNYDLLREMGVAKVGTRAKVLHAIKELILDDARMEPLAWNSGNMGPVNGIASFMPLQRTGTVQGLLGAGRGPGATIQRGPNLRYNTQQLLVDDQDDPLPAPRGAAFPELPPKMSTSKVPFSSSSRNRPPRRIDTNLVLPASAATKSHTQPLVRSAPLRSPGPHAVATSLFPPEGPTVVVSDEHGMRSSTWNSLRRRSPDRKIRLVDEGVSFADATTEMRFPLSPGSLESEEAKSPGSWDRVRRFFTASPRSASSLASPKNLQPPSATLIEAPSPTRAWQLKLNIPSNNNAYASNPPPALRTPINNNSAYQHQSSSAQSAIKQPITPTNPVLSGRASGRNLVQSIAAQISLRFSKSLGTDSYFGERPPDNVIAANLESFFPDLQEDRFPPTSPSATLTTTTFDMGTLVASGNVSAPPRSSPTLSTSRDYIPSLISTTRSAALNQAKRTSRTMADSIKPRVHQALARKLERALFMKGGTRSLAGSPQSSSSFLNSFQSPHFAASSVNVSPKSGVPVSTKKSVNWIKGPLIGQGAFGKVYYGVNMISGEIMAVKQVSIGDKDDKAKKSREKALASEMALLSTLDHPNIVRYFGHEVTVSFFNVFLEYVPGGSISTCLSKYGKFDEDLTRSLTFQVLCGLSYLHDGGIIHRDIKAANILLDDFGCAKISDFGISKRLDSLIYESDSRHSLQGSIYWMAPEVARNQGYSAKVDIWGLGCLVLEMLTGHHPWHKVPGHILYLLGTGKTPPLPEDINIQSRDFLTQCLIVDAEKRPTVSDCLLLPFAIFDPDTFNFSAWTEIASERVLNESTYASALNSNFKMKREADRRQKSWEVNEAIAPLKEILNAGSWGVSQEVRDLPAEVIAFFLQPPPPDNVPLKWKLTSRFLTLCMYRYLGDLELLRRAKCWARDEVNGKLLTTNGIEVESIRQRKLQLKKQNGMRMEVFAACNKAALALGVSVLPDLAIASKNMLVCEGPGNFYQKGVGIIGPSPHNPSRISSDISSGMSLNVRPNSIVSIDNSVDGRLT